MILNPELIHNRCGEIAESLTRLEKIKDVNKESFLKDQDLLDIASYRLLVAIEAALNLCYHVSAKKLKKIPREYAECFVILTENKIIPKEFGGELAKMAKFRNMLVPVYWKIDYEIIFDIIHNHLDCLRQFSKIAADLI
jgi:uncharacterized protein YutE (UPF0331/DUF86 family)